MTPQVVAAAAMGPENSPRFWLVTFAAAVANEVPGLGARYGQPLEYLEHVDEQQQQSGNKCIRQLYFYIIIAYQDYNTLAGLAHTSRLGLGSGERSITMENFLAVSTSSSLGSHSSRPAVMAFLLSSPRVSTEFS